MHDCHLFPRSCICWKISVTKQCSSDRCLLSCSYTAASPFFWCLLSCSNTAATPFFFPIITEVPSDLTYPSFVNEDHYQHNIAWFLPQWRHCLKQSLSVLCKCSLINNFWFWLKLHLQIYFMHQNVCTLICYQQMKSSSMNCICLTKILHFTNIGIILLQPPVRIFPRDHEFPAQNAWTHSFYFKDYIISWKFHHIATSWLVLCELHPPPHNLLLFQ